jgi:hypothetical protein
MDCTSAIVTSVIVIFGIYIVTLIKKTTISIRKIKQNDKFMLSVILFLAITFGMLFSVNLILILMDLKILKMSKAFVAINMITPYFFMVACTLNARNWAQFYLQIKEAALVLTTSDISIINDFHV